MRISDWSSDVCSSDLQRAGNGEGHHHGIESDEGQGRGKAVRRHQRHQRFVVPLEGIEAHIAVAAAGEEGDEPEEKHDRRQQSLQHWPRPGGLWARLRHRAPLARPWRSEEHTSELQSLMRISYAVFCLTNK